MQVMAPQGLEIYGARRPPACLLAGKASSRYSLAFNLYSGTGIGSDVKEPLRL